MVGTIQILTGPGAMALVGAGGPLLIDREALGQMIDFLVALHDIAEPEPDLEEVGAEDSFCAHPANGPGCIASDTAEDGDEDCCAGRDDIGTDHKATKKLRFDWPLAADDQDAEDSFDREEVREDY